MILLASASLLAFETRALAKTPFDGPWRITTTTTAGECERVASILVDNVIAVIKGRRPPNLYNPEIYG